MLVIALGSLVATVCVWPVRLSHRTAWISDDAATAERLAPEARAANPCAIVWKQGDIMVHLTQTATAQAQHAAVATLTSPPLWFHGRAGLVCRARAGNS